MNNYSTLSGLRGTNLGDSGIIDSLIPGGGLISSVLTSFGPSKQDADHTQVLFNQYLANPTPPRPAIFPTKAEMLQGNLSQADRDGITANYNEQNGTWAPPGSDFRGAVTGYGPTGNILISTFKGSTERYNGDLGVKSLKAQGLAPGLVQQAQNIFSSAPSYSNQNPNAPLTASGPSTTLWVVGGSALALALLFVAKGFIDKKKSLDGVKGKKSKSK